MENKREDFELREYIGDVVGTLIDRIYARVLTEVREGLFIGSFQAAKTASEDYTTVTLVEDCVPTTEYHQPLVDGHGISTDNFVRAVELVQSAWESHQQVIVHCKAGMSRSVVVTATALTAIENNYFQTVMDEIRAERNLILPHDALINMALSYLEQESYRSTKVGIRNS